MDIQNFYALQRCHKKLTQYKNIVIASQYLQRYTEAENTKKLLDSFRPDWISKKKAFAGGTGSI